jgi:hypothetical protein
MTSVVYYLPAIPDNQSKTEYNHALAIPGVTDRAAIMTYAGDIPSEIARRYDAQYELASDRLLPRAVEAKRKAAAFHAACESGSTVFLTTFHVVPGLAGWLSDHEWVLDVYDSPLQIYYANTKPTYRVAIAVLSKLLDTADRGVHTAHPRTPQTFGEEILFATNGAAVNAIEPSLPAPDTGPLHGVCAGVKGGMALLLEALSEGTVEMTVDVFGTVPRRDRDLAADLGVDERVTYHGDTPHESVVSTIRAADVGFCLMPGRPDWRYAHPIRLGEYLAAGTVPIASSLPGCQRLLRDAGILVDNDVADLTKVLRTVADTPGLLDALGARARRRGEELAWARERTWFARQAIHGRDAWRQGLDE